MILDGYLQFSAPAMPRGVAKSYAALIPTPLCEVQACTVFDTQWNGLDTTIVGYTCSYM